MCRVRPLIEEVHAEPRPNMTKLLVSVRNASEALTALAAGADLIDVKEPDHGALGAADPATIAAVVSSVAERVPTSAALGELLAAGTLPAMLPARLHFAKLGLAGCRHVDDWPTHWRAAIASLPSRIAPVVVAYADYRNANSPEPWSLLPLAQGLECRGLVLDTFDKQEGKLGDYLSRADLRRWLAAVRSAGMTSVVAGGLGLDDLVEVAQLGPDYVGVRGAACTGGRIGTIDAALIRSLLEAIGRNTPEIPASSSSISRAAAESSPVLPG
jgi:(5-formylfuran-3-yl)methyl phosphate synthase